MKHSSKQAACMYNRALFHIAFIPYHQWKDSSFSLDPWEDHALPGCW